MKKMSIAVMAVLAVSTLDLGAAPARDVRVFVDGAECRGLKALGKAVARPVGEATLFTAGGSFANRWLTDASVGPGNFFVKVRLSIDNPIFCDASIRVGGGERELIVTLQGINGLFSVSGPLVRTDLETGRVMKSEVQVRGKKPFELAIERVGDQLSVSCDGRLIRRHTVTDGGLGPVGIVPMRGAMRIERLEVTANFAPFVVARNAGARVAYAYIDEPVPGELWISSMQGGLRARTTLAELKAAAKGCP